MIRTRTIKSFINALELNAELTHRHYVSDNEYIQHGEDIEVFLKREIGKEIIVIRTARSLGMRFCRISIYKYQPPESADKILEQFWMLEKEAERLLGGLT